MDDRRTPSDDDSRAESDGTRGLGGPDAGSPGGMGGSGVAGATGGKGPPGGLSPLRPDEEEG